MQSAAFLSEIRKHLKDRTAAWGFLSAGGKVLLSLMAETRDRDLLPTLGAPTLSGHRIRNLAAKVPEDVWPGFKAPATATDQAP